MTSFISLEPEAVMAASGMTAGLAGEAAGHGGQVAASAAAVPPGIEEISVANAAKIAAIARAQADGTVTDRFPPEILLGLVLVIATSWSDLPAGFEAISRDHTAAQRRGYVIDAVARLVAPESRP